MELLPLISANRLGATCAQCPFRCFLWIVVSVIGLWSICRQWGWGRLVLTVSWLILSMGGNLKRTGKAAETSVALRIPSSVRQGLKPHQSRRIKAQNSLLASQPASQPVWESLQLEALAHSLCFFPLYIFLSRSISPILYFLTISQPLAFFLFSI